MLLVTGGAGFIGSNLVAALNAAGRTDVAVIDVLGTGDKWRNLQKHQICDFVHPDEAQKWLVGRSLDAVIHLGAISDTTATDGDRVIADNFRYSLALLDWCTHAHTPFIYASSAATYGDGSSGFDDNQSLQHLRRLRPLNLYGWSKHLFDLVVADRHAKQERLPPQWVGLKFFNVFGPNEFHKGRMASVIASVFQGAREGKPVKLFKSHRSEFADGEQKRDFIYVDDVVSVMLWLLSQRHISGIFNVGTGKARSFRDLADALFAALKRSPNIEYIDIPDEIREKYQYFTQATVKRLHGAGYNADFTSLEEGVRAYVQDFLLQSDPYR
jgi:ADP-L-glycero-D-manno-heptose 6-epimerase